MTATALCTRGQGPEPSGASEGGLKVAQHTPLLEADEPRLYQRGSPKRLALDLRRGHPDNSDLRVSLETICQALYALPRGQLNQDQLSCHATARLTACHELHDKGSSAAARINASECIGGVRVDRGPGDKPWWRAQEVD